MSFLEVLLLSILAVIYLTCIFTVAAITFRNGHWILQSGDFLPRVLVDRCGTPCRAQKLHRSG